MNKVTLQPQAKTYKFAVPIAEDSSVMVRFGRKGVYAGKVQRILDDKFYIRFNDGDFRIKKFEDIVGVFVKPFKFSSASEYIVS